VHTMDCGIGANVFSNLRLLKLITSAILCRLRKLFPQSCDNCGTKYFL